MFDSDSLFESIHSLIQSSRNTFAVNRKVMEKAIDTAWVEAIEKGLVNIDNVLRNPRKTIEDVEEIVPIALSKKITVESIRHLAQHTDLIQSVDEKTGKITPSKVLNVHKEESMMTYENKFVNTLIDRLYIFVNRRYEKLREVSKDEEIFTLAYNTDVNEDSGKRMSITLKIETADSLERADDKGFTVWERVEKVKKAIESYKASNFCQALGNAYIRPPVMRTNAIMKNIDLKACLVLWQFVESYDKIGYEINVSDTAQKPSDSYIADLYNLIALNFLLFRSYTQDETKSFEELKTKAGKIIAPKIVKQFSKQSSDEFNIAVSAAAESVSSEEAVLETAQLPADADELIREIDEVIKIETAYQAVEEEIRLAELKAAEEAAKKRLEEERQREEAEKLAEKRRLEEEQNESLRIEREKREKLEREKQEKLEQERLEREREEFEKQEKIRLENEAKAAAERAENERIEREKAAIKAKETAERLERERKNVERAQRLREERAEIEKQDFSEIYFEYSRNPFYIAARLIRNLSRKISGKTAESVRNDKIKKQERIEQKAASKAEKKQLKIDKKLEIKQIKENEKREKQQLQVIYANYAQTPICRLKRRIKKIKYKLKNINKPKKSFKSYSKQPVRVLTPEEERIENERVKALFKEYKVTFHEKLKRKFGKYFSRGQH